MCIVGKIIDLKSFYRYLLWQKFNYHCVKKSILIVAKQARKLQDAQAEKLTSLQAEKLTS